MSSHNNTLHNCISIHKIKDFNIPSELSYKILVVMRGISIGMNVNFYLHPFSDDYELGLISDNHELKNKFVKTLITTFEEEINYIYDNLKFLIFNDWYSFELLDKIHLFRWMRFTNEELYYEFANSLMIILNFFWECSQDRELHQLTESIYKKEMGIFIYKNLKDYIDDIKLIKTSDILKSKLEFSFKSMDISDFEQIHDLPNQLVKVFEDEIEFIYENRKLLIKPFAHSGFNLTRLELFDWMNSTSKEFFHRFKHYLVICFFSLSNTYSTLREIEYNEKIIKKWYGFDSGIEYFDLYVRDICSDAKLGIALGHHNVEINIKKWIGYLIFKFLKPYLDYPIF